jgi:hypothetical protein
MYCVKSVFGKRLLMGWSRRLFSLDAVGDNEEYHAPDNHCYSFFCCGFYTLYSDEDQQSSEYYGKENCCHYCGLEHLFFHWLTSKGIAEGGIKVFPSLW